METMRKCVFHSIKHSRPNKRYSSSSEADKTTIPTEEPNGIMSSRSRQLSLGFGSYPSVSSGCKGKKTQEQEKLQNRTTAAVVVVPVK